MAHAPDAGAPVGDAFAALPPALAVLGATLGKQFNLTIEDDGTRVSQPVARALRTILPHLVCNAAGHGIEAPGARRAAGKAAAGTIAVAAWRDGPRLRLRVRDDGCGIDLTALGARARALGAVGAAELAAMSAAEQAGLVFRPGVTTAAHPTLLSGRGIGLDVVAHTVAGLGGDLAVTTAPGTGTVFEISVPVGAGATAAAA
jgi:two-component system chemotaxis sensor kinase CheA